MSDEYTAVPKLDRIEKPEPNQWVYWYGEYPRGYNLPFKTPAIVRRVGPKRVYIEVRTSRGETAFRWVRRDRIGVRATPCEALAESLPVPTADGEPYRVDPVTGATNELEHNEEEP